MFSHIWLFILLTLCSIAWLSRILIPNRRRAHPRLPPGPLGLPVVGNLPFLDPQLHAYSADLAKTYGPILTLRLGGKIGIIVSSPSIAKQIFKDYDATFASHDVPAVIKGSVYGASDMIFAPYGPESRMLRKVFVHEMLGSTTLDATYGFRKYEIRQMMQYLMEQSGSVVNVGEQMFLTTMNVVTSMLWGDTVKGEEREKLAAKFRSLVAEFTNLAGDLNISDFFPGLSRFDLQGIVKKMKGCEKKLDELFEDVIVQRRKMENVEDGKDLLQVLLKLKDSKIPFTMIHLKALLIDMFVGGIETVSHTIEFAMAELVNKPKVMRRAQQELEDVLGSSNGSLEESHMNQLPYLQAIVKETLRLHPVIALTVPRCPTESCTVGGYTIPQGSNLSVNIWAIHRDPSIWEDPLDFKPERFLGEKRYDFSGNDFTYFPFGSGRRMCAGVALAERMLSYPLASLLRYFDWKLPEGVEKVDLDDKFGITMKKRTPLLLIPSVRSSELDMLSSS